MEFDGVRINGVLWLKEALTWVPLCPKHHIRMDLVTNDFDSSTIRCEECLGNYTLPREFQTQIRYVENKIDSTEIKKKKFINFDDEWIAIEKDSTKSSDGKYFVKAILTESKVGLRLVVYAGEKGKEKTQIFLEPEIKRLAFDQNDTHPSDVFLKLEAFF